MKKNNFCKIKVLYIITFLLLSILSLFNISAQEKPADKIFKIEIENNFVNVDLKNAEISEILKEIEKKSRVKISITEGLVGKKVTIRFENFEIDKAIKTILGENYVFVFSWDSTNKEKYILKEVSALSRTQERLKSKKITKEIAYGKEKENVGVAYSSGDGALGGGPGSFTIDDNGYIYIDDGVNKRFQIFSPKGEYVSSINIKRGNDFVVDSAGFIYTYDPQPTHIDKLYQYDKKGNIIKSIDVDWNNCSTCYRWDAYPHYLLLHNNKIYTKACDLAKKCGYFLIGKTENGILNSPTYEERKNPFPKEELTLSGRRYKYIKLQETGGLDLEIIEKDGQIYKRIATPKKKGVYIDFLGEDIKGNFYFKTEHRENKKYIIEVHKYNADGNYIATILQPEYESYFRTLENFYLGKDGTIYWFFPEEDKLILEIVPTE